MAVTSMDYVHDANIGTGYGKKPGTQQKKFSTKSEFSDWIRQFGVKDSPRYRPLLDTWNEYGHRVYDVDFIIWNKPSGRYFFLEEKTNDARMKHDQALLYFKLDTILSQADPLFLGFHFLRFENTTPDNGLIFLDEKMVDVETLLQFIEMQQPIGMYRSWFQKLADDGIDWKYKLQT